MPYFWRVAQCVRRLKVFEVASVKAVDAGTYPVQRCPKKAPRSSRLGLVAKALMARPACARADRIAKELELEPVLFMKPSIGALLVVAAVSAALLYADATFVNVQQPPPAAARDQSAQPIAFEVASVKPNPVPPNHVIIPKYPDRPIPRATGNRYSAPHATVQDLIMQAYGVNDYQISGLSDWAKAPLGEHYDIEAKTAGEGNPPTDLLQKMLQSLLADRFQLKLHRDEKDLPVYVLVVVKTGSKLRRLGDNEQIPRYATRPPQMPTNKGTFEGLLRLLRLYADRPIIDETGLSGGYEFADLGLGQFAQLRREDPLGAQNTLSAAIQEKLGLTLHSTKRVTEVLVIEHVQRPSQN